MAGANSNSLRRASYERNTYTSRHKSRVVTTILSAICVTKEGGASGQSKRGYIINYLLRKQFI